MFSKTDLAQKTALEQSLYNLPLEFNKVTVSSVEQLSEKIIQLYTITYDAIANLSKTPELLSYQTVVQPLIDLGIYSKKAESLCSFPEQIHTDKDVREACQKAVIAIQDVIIELIQRDDVFQVFRLYENGAYNFEQTQLDAEQRRFLTQFMREYKRNGLYIEDAATKQKVTAIKQQISKLCIDFLHHVDDENSSFLVPVAELDGLPNSWFTEEREQEPGVYKVTLKYPDLFPILDYATNRNLRKKIFKDYEARCQQDNLPLLKQILLLRNELAQLLNYKTYADFVTETRMAKDSKTVRTFLDDLNVRFTPLLTDNLNALTAFARAKEQDEGLQLEVYDIRYYTRLREEELCSINMEAIKEYFPLQTLINGTFKIYENLLGLKFIARDNNTSWHPDVQYFDVYDYDSASDTKKDCIGGFYLDLHPREGKYGHAAAFGLLPRCDISHLAGQATSKQFGLSAMVCNFPKNENISFENVTTFFHEFGHLMHFTCSDTKLESFHADHTETDFVEAPSQMLENWCFEPAALKLLSGHYQTQQPLPQEMAQKLKAMDKIHSGYTQKRQLVFATFDLNVHTMSNEALQRLDIGDYYNKLRADILQLPKLSGCFPASFGHLVGGYDAGYYGYLMSATYAADMYETAFEKDPLSVEQGARYRKFILQPGSSLDGIDLLKNFLGREPRIDAFMRQHGLSTSCSATTKSVAELGFFEQAKADPTDKRQCNERAESSNGLT